MQGGNSFHYYPTAAPSSAPSSHQYLPTLLHELQGPAARQYLPTLLHEQLP